MCNATSACSSNLAKSSICIREAREGHVTLAYIHLVTDAEPPWQKCGGKGKSEAILFVRMSFSTMYQRNLRTASTCETTVSFVPRVAMPSVQGCEETVSRCLHSNSHVPAYYTCNIADDHRRYRATCTFHLQIFHGAASHG